MIKVQKRVECPVHQSFRTAQLAGMFDVTVAEKLSESFSAEVPSTEEDWQIGVIVGPSGSGKSTIAREAFGKNLYEGGRRWPKDQAVVDGFGERSIKEITHALTAVGFSSPPSWLKPYRVLSNGEKFRCDLARALVCGGDLVAYDEFSSVVDRTVAKIGSAAVAKAIRKRKLGRRFVAVTCHYDVVEWLQPDWVVDMASGRLARGRLRRPKIRLEIAPVHYSAWVLFRRHHYLSGNLSVTAFCFAAFWEQQPVGFSAWVNRGAYGTVTRQQAGQAKREHRTVVLPDYQGLGIGNRLSEFCASIWRGLGYGTFSTTSHPAMIRYRSRSPHWKRLRLRMTSPSWRPEERRAGKRTTSADRLIGGFQYVGPAMDRARAEAFVTARPAPFAKRPSVVLVESLVRRHPGATVSLLARLAGMSTTGVRRNLDELLAAGEITRQGTGGGHGRQQAFYAKAE